MAKSNWKLLKGQLPKKAAPGTKGAPGDFALHVSETGLVTVFGSTAKGEIRDIKDEATLTVTSGNPAAVTVDTPSGMSFTETAVAVGHSDVELAVTFTDGSVGPFTATDPVDVQQDPVTGLSIVHQPPVAH